MLLDAKFILLDELNDSLYGNCLSMNSNRIPMIQIT